MIKNNFFLYFSCFLILFLHACSDAVVPGKRDEVFKSIDYVKDTNMLSAVVSDPITIKNWPVEGGNLNKSCANAYVKNVTSYKLIKKWSNYIEKFDESTEYISSPVVYEGKVFYLSKNSELLAFDLNTGKKLFKHPLLDKIVDEDIFPSYGGIGVDNADIFASLVDGSIVSVSISDNKPKINWSQNIGSVGASPVIYKDIVIVNTRKNSIYALDRTTGKILWVFNTVTDMTTMSKIGSVSISNDKVFVTMQNLESYVLDVNTGALFGVDSLIGKSYFSSPMSFISAVVSPVINNGIMLSANTDNLFSAISYSNSKEINKLWTLPFGTYASPCFNNEIAFIATSSNQVLAVNANNGKIIWDLNLLSKAEDKDFYILGILLINNNLIINTNKGDVFFINSVTGEFISRQHLSDGFISSIIIVDNNIIVVDIDGYIVNYKL